MRLLFRFAFLIIMVMTNWSLSLNAQMTGSDLAALNRDIDAKLVYIIVSSNVYYHQPDNVQANLARYIQDIQLDGYQAETIVWADTLNGIPHAESIRQLLSNAYMNENLDGAIFIGRVPYAMYFQYDWEGTAYGYPLDLYYRDLNGIWSDSDGDGLLDDHRGGISSEIWAGRIDPWPLVQTLGNGTVTEEIAAINNFFSKDHAFRVKDISTSIGTVSRRGLLYSNGYAATGGDWLRMIYPDVTEVFDENTTIQNYVNLLDTTGPGYESVLIGSHGAGSSFADGSFHVEEILHYDPKTVFINIYSCEPNRFDRALPGTAYVFAPSNGITTIGPSNSGVSVAWDFYSYLSQGYSIGESLREWSVFNAMWDQNYGLTILGDPLLILPNSDWLSNHTHPQQPSPPQAAPNSMGYPEEVMTFSFGPANLESATFIVNWDDGTFSFSPPIQDGEIIQLNHIFHEEGSYLVRAQLQGPDSGRSIWSEPVNVFITSACPAAPKKAILYATDSVAYLNWSPVTTNASGYPLNELPGYHIYRRDDDNSPWVFIGQQSFDSTFYLDFNNPGPSYQYAIAALANGTYESVLTPAITVPCGDLNLDERVNVLDISALLEFLYRSHTAPPIVALADFNNNGVNNIIDVSFLLTFLYKGGAAPPEKFGLCHAIIRSSE